MRSIIFIPLCFAFFADQLMQINADIWLSAFLGWFCYCCLHFEYAASKCRKADNSFSWAHYWADNGVVIGISLLVVAPAVFVLNELQPLSSLMAWMVGYLNIQAIRAMRKRAKIFPGE